jgi:Ketopantoate reductase PanE/ApbA C terminal
VGYEVEPIYGIPTQRYLDAYAGKGLSELLAEIAAIARARGGGQPSLLQDVLKGRRTEIDYLNGYVCREGARVGVKTPFNDAIVAAVQAQGVGFKPDRALLDPVARMLPGSFQPNR